MATIKQKKAAKEVIDVMEGKSNLTGQRILEKVGYSKGIAKNPKKVLESKGFQEILDEYLPDEFLMRKHSELLNAEIRTRKISNGEVITEEKRIDGNSVGKGLDMAYKLKGSYAAEKKNLTVGNEEGKEFKIRFVSED